MKTLIFQRVLPYYRLPLFRLLQKKLGTIVCFSRENPAISLRSVAPEKVDFPHEYLARTYFSGSETLMVQNILAPLLKHRPSVVISEAALAYLSLWLLILLRPFFGFRLVLWGHGIRNEQILKPFADAKGALTLWLFRRADALLFYSEDRKSLVEKFLPGGPPCFVAPNSIDLEPYEILLARLEKEGREKVKKRLGFAEEKTHFIWIGRLLADKRPDLLFAAFQKLDFPCHLHVVGVGPELEKMKALKIPNVTFYGEVFDETITGELLFCSDLFVMPGYLGLSVLHAFVMGMPVLSCKTTETGPFHSPEICYLVEGKNGLLVDSSAEALALAISGLHKNPQKWKELKESARDTGRKSGLESMVKGFAAAIAAASK